MKAVIFNGVKDVSVEDRPKPSIQHPRDVIVKVRYTALCGRCVHPSHSTPAPTPTTNTNL